MPRYFFDTHDMPDEEGVDFANDDEARAEAMVAAGSMLHDAGKAIWQQLPWKMQVRDESGAVIGTLALSASWNASPEAR